MVPGLFQVADFDSKTSSANPQAGAGFALAAPVIAVNNNLTIIGNGNTIERDTTIWGVSNFRLFDVGVGAALTLVNLTLQNGFAYGTGASGCGGAIYSQGDLTLDGVTVQGNTAEGAASGNGGTGGDGLGGALYVAGATATIHASRGGVVA